LGYSGLVGYLKRNSNRSVRKRQQNDRKRKTDKDRKRE
jgi:hypothetical protein